MAGFPELRRDPLSGRPVTIAPGRSQRPGAAVQPVGEPAVDAECPFCEGHESETPPETYASGPLGRVPDTPSWRVRVVPNKFPAFAGSAGRQEVVVHSPRHVRSLSDLGVAELDEVAAAWRSRNRAAQQAGFTYVQALLNEGRAAGASRSHTHSQLVWLQAEPPLVAQERATFAGTSGCVLCRHLDEERALGVRVVLEEDGVLALAAYAGRVPYELLVAPVACEPSAFVGSTLESALRTVAQAIRRLRAVEAEAPLNAWVHSFPLGEGHWHIEVVPRLVVFAGLELGAGLFVNPLAPETAAERLRADG